MPLWWHTFFRDSTVPLHCTCTALHCAALHCTTLHYTTLHLTVLCSTICLSLPSPRAWRRGHRRRNTSSRSYSVKQHARDCVMRLTVLFIVVRNLKLPLCLCLCLYLYLMSTLTPHRSTSSTPMTAGSQLPAASQQQAFFSHKTRSTPTAGVGSGHTPGRLPRGQYISDAACYLRRILKSGAKPMWNFTR
jgi:hypothetical protein